MAETDMLLMSAVIFVPAIFALGLLFFPRGSEEWMRWWSLLGTAITLVVSLCVFIDYSHMLDKDMTRRGRADDPTTLLARHDAAVKSNVRAESDKTPSYDSDDWLSRYPWIARFNIDYYIGIDGISLPLVLLTTLLSFLAMIASWNIEKHVRGYCALFLLLETGMIGTFVSLDFFLFYIFWEVMLLPMYFLIGIWGGPRREYAAIKFFLYTLLGSVFILIALLGFYFTNVRDFVPQSQVDQVARDRMTEDQKQLKGAAYQAALLRVRDGLEMTAAGEVKKVGEAVAVNTFDLMTLQR